MITEIEQMQKLFDLSFKIGITYIEKLARQHLTKHSHLKEFIMAKGKAFFTSKENSEIVKCVPLDAFLEKWDYIYHFTGEPMRFTAKGKVIIDF